jgi:hypothetical protein
MTEWIVHGTECECSVCLWNIFTTIDLYAEMTSDIKQCIRSYLMKSLQSRMHLTNGSLKLIKPTTSRLMDWQFVNDYKTIRWSTSKLDTCQWKLKDDSSIGLITSSQIKLYRCGLYMVYVHLVLHPRYNDRKFELSILADGKNIHKQPCINSIIQTTVTLSQSWSCVLDFELTHNTISIDDIESILKYSECIVIQSCN